MLLHIAPMDKDVFQKLPLELIRTIFSFCSSSEIVLLLPCVSRLLYQACWDTNLLRNVIRRDLIKHLDKVKTRQDSEAKLLSSDRNSEAAVHKALRCIDFASRSFKHPESCWRRWAIGLSLIQTKAFVAESKSDIINFDMLLKLMRYLPHSLLIGVPILKDQNEHHWIIEIIAFFFLDVTGGPAFRTKHYVGGLNMYEMNSRMALCMTALVLQLRDESQLFKQEKRLADQSIAGWIGSAVVYSRDWLAMNNQPPRTEAKMPTNAEVQTFITVIFIGIALLRHKDDASIMLPDMSKLPLFSAVDPLGWQQERIFPEDAPIAVVPTPLDLQKPQVEPRTEHSELKIDEIGLESILSIYHRTTLENINEYFQGVWCIYYIVGRHCSLRDMLVMPPVRGVRLRASSVAHDKWTIESDPFEEDSTLFRLSGRLVNSGGIGRVVIHKSAEEGRPLYEAHSHGQMSPFGISGGYFYTNPWAPAVEGGLFWMFKENWVTDETKFFD